MTLTNVHFSVIKVLTVVTCRLPGWEEGVCERVCRGETALHNLPLVAAKGGDADHHGVGERT